MPRSWDDSKILSKVPVRRYQWENSGDMIHVDTKQLARFERVGHRITGDRRPGSSRGAGYEKVHVAIDDPTRLAVEPRGELWQTRGDTHRRAEGDDRWLLGPCAWLVL